MSASQMGWIFSAFTFSLMLGCVLMTLITAFLGTRWGLMVSFLGMSLAALASGFASTLTGLILSRFLLGLFMGGLLPAAIQSVREWFPAKLRPLAIGLIIASGSVVAVLTPPLVAYISKPVAWRAVLMIAGIPTLVAAVLCFAVWQYAPPRGKSENVTGGGLASAGMLAAGLFLASPILTFVVTWMPMFLRQELHAALDYASISFIAVSAAGVCGALLAGGLAAVAAHSGMSPSLSASRTRAILLTAFGLLLPAVALAGNAGKWEFAILFAAVSSMAYQGWATLLYSAIADTLPSRGVAAGAAFGALALHLSSLVSPAIFGQVIQRNGYSLVFLMITATAALSLLIVGLLAWLVPQEASN